MYEIKEDTLKKAYKPFDVVSFGDSVGYISEVSVNTGQPEEHQIKYSVTWLINCKQKTSWWYHRDLTYHCNFFVKIAEDMCHPFGSNSDYAEKILRP